MTTQIDLLIDKLKRFNVILYLYSLIQILFQEIHITLGSGLCQIRRLYILLHDGRIKQIK